MSNAVINLFYLLTAVLFIFAIKGLSNPKTAVWGNLLGAIGMLIAVVATLLDRRIVSYEVILAGLLTGSLIGSVLAWKIPMTAMPQLVAIFNGMDAGASMLVAATELEKELLSGHFEAFTGIFRVSVVEAGLVGTLSLAGSIIAFGKLQGLIMERPLLLPGRHVINIALLAISLGLAAWFIAQPTSALPFWLLVASSALLGFMLVLPIGGADMPVFISLLNAYSGLAAAGSGWVVNNNLLIIAGSLVATSGFILTALMCKAMNRSLVNVIFGGVGSAVMREEETEDIYAGKVKATAPEEVAMLLEGARRVVIAPGYGMAVSQAQYAVADLMNLLESRGTEVEFAIHPVAGRMPGHMNVLLAEANVPYEKLKEMDEINPTFKQTDVVLVIGANDVVNPLARNADPSLPIAGMPILNVDEARTVVVIKRSLSPGFSGLPNPLFAADNTLMYFADGKKAILDLIAALKES